MIQQAGIINLLRTLLFFIIILYALRVFFRYVLPWLLKNAIERASKKAQDFKTDVKKEKEGKTYIYKKPKKKFEKEHKIGDYTDYEEVE